MSIKLTKLCTLLTIVMVIAYCFVRDTKIEKQYCGDLRNRIVGARLQLDGKLPYFYKWQAKDGVKYYDPQNFDSLKVSNITASPFMHALLYPIAHLPQSSISSIWLICQYIMFVTMLLIAIYFCNNSMQIIGTALVSCIFLFSTWWLQHVANGQIYIVIPFLLLLFIVFLKPKRTASLLAASICAVALIAIRPTLLCFFLPFLPFIIAFNRQQIFAFFSAPLLFICFICSNKQQLVLWQNYKHGIVEQIKLHQNLHPIAQKNSISPNFRFWEGYDTATIHINNLNPLIIKSSNGNLFAFYQTIFNQKISVTMLNAIAIGLIAIFLLFFYANSSNQLLEINNTALWGFCMYTISEFLSPIHRHHYNAVIWLFPILIMAIQHQKEQKLFYGCIIFSLCLSVNTFTIVHLPNIIIEIAIWIMVVLFLYRNTNAVHKCNITLL